MNNPKSAGKDTKRKVVIVTGMSGAGKSTGLDALEDMGYEAIDNLPLPYLKRLLSKDDSEGSDDIPLAICIDARSRSTPSTHFSAMLDELNKRADIDLNVIYFDCDDTTLINRFSETRRPHPLAPDRPVPDGIAREREKMSPIRGKATSIMDTSNLTSAETRRRLVEAFSLGEDTGLVITTMSFGYSKGVPRDADLVFDVRFLRNPHYDPDLKPLTGRDPLVAAFVAEDTNFEQFKKEILSLITFLIPLYVQEGKTHLTIAFGCTGGRHRSVMMAEMMGIQLKDLARRLNIVHRDTPVERRRRSDFGPAE